MELFSLDVLPAHTAVGCELNADGTVRFRATQLTRWRKRVKRESQWTRHYTERELPVKLRWGEFVW